MMPQICAFSEDSTMRASLGFLFIYYSKVRQLRNEEQKREVKKKDIQLETKKKWKKVWIA